MILMNDFKAEPIALQEAMLDSVSRVLKSGWYVLGKEVECFENAWAKTCGTSHAVGVGNGLDAIEIALRAAGIGPGDEVITTPMTAFATVLGIVRAGATPVLADIVPHSGLLSIESVSRCISSRTKAIVLVHLYGQLRNMAAWVDFCSGHGIHLVEDCAQAHLAAAAGGFAGSFGRAGAYSFYPTKNLGTMGDAGALVTNDSELTAKATRLRNYGQSVRYYHQELGMNSRLDEIHAAILLERLQWLPVFTEKRQRIARIYSENIRNTKVRLLAPPEEQSAHVYHLFVVTCQNRDALQAHLHEAGIQTLIHYPIPLHRQDPCRGIKCDPRGLQKSEEHARSCLSLPCHPQMLDADIEAVVAAVNSFGGK